MKGYEFLLKRIDQQRDYIQQVMARNDLNEERRTEILVSATGVLKNLKWYLIPSNYVKYFD